MNWRINIIIYLRSPVVFYKPLSELAEIIHVGQNNTITATVFRNSVKHVWNWTARNAVGHKNVHDVLYDAGSVWSKAKLTSAPPWKVPGGANLHGTLKCHCNNRNYCASTDHASKFKFPRAKKKVSNPQFDPAPSKKFASPVLGRKCLKNIGC